MGRGLSPEDRAALQRWTFRAYNACETGDLEDPKAVFDKLDRQKKERSSPWTLSEVLSEDSHLFDHRATRHSVTRWMRRLQQTHYRVAACVLLSRRPSSTRVAISVRFRTNVINYRLRANLAHCAIIERELPANAGHPVRQAILISTSRLIAVGWDCKFGGGVAA